MQEMHGAHCTCNMLGGHRSRQLAFGASVLAVAQTQPMPTMEKLIMQGLKEVTMHEVGHTLGLRHNFKASTLYSLADLNDAEKTKETGLTASVMDYNPANIMPEGEEARRLLLDDDRPLRHVGDRVWLQAAHGRIARRRMAELKKIATRSGEPGLAYSTDEDTRGIDPDPHTNRFDMGNDLLEYAKSQAKLVPESLPHVDRRLDQGRRRLPTSPPGVRHAAGSAWRGDVLRLALRRRPVRQPQPQGRREGAEAARRRSGRTATGERWRLLEEQVFSDKPFNFPPELYNHLAASRWNHWGSQAADRGDYPAHDVILMWQDRILSKLLSPLTLVAAARHRAEDARRCRRAHDGRADRAADQGDVLRSRRDERRRVHQSQAGDLQPAAQPAAVVFAAVVATGAGQDDRRRRIARRSPTPSLAS